MALLGREFIAVPDDHKGQVVYKWPDHSIRRYTRAIVNADEVALFVNTGKVVQTLGPGRHQIDADEIPGLGILIDAATAGRAYRAELYFVGSREYTGFNFGGRVDDVQDPQTGLIVTLRVFGDYALRVVDPITLITNLVSTVDVTDNSKISNWVSDQLLKVMRMDVTTQIVRNGWPILGLSAYTQDIEQNVIAKTNEQLSAYGVALTRMGNFDINLAPEDQAQLKTLAKDTRYSRLAGGFNNYAAGELALGAGAGMAQGRRRRRRRVPRPPGSAPVAWPSRSRRAPRRPGPASPAAAPAVTWARRPVARRLPAAIGAPAAGGAACANCPAANPGGAKFCANCGQPMAAAPAHCMNCGTELVAGREVLRLVRHPGRGRRRGCHRLRRPPRRSHPRCPRRPASGGSAPQFSGSSAKSRFALLVPAHARDRVLPPTLHVLQRLRVGQVAGRHRVLEMLILGLDDLVGVLAGASARSHGPPNCLHVIVFIGGCSLSDLVDADEVARGIAERAVANAIGLLGRFLDDLAVGGLQPGEGAVEVRGGQGDDPVGALGHHLGDGATLVVGDGRVDARRVQDDGRAGLAGRSDGDPVQPVVTDVVADLEAEGVAVKGQRRVRVVVRKETRVDGDVHAGHASCGRGFGASRFLTGLVTCFVTHDGISGGGSPDWAAGRLGRLAAIDAGRHADEFGEPGAERAQRRATDGETDLGHAEVAPAQQRHRSFDTSRHQVAVGGLAVGPAELAAQVPGRHVRAAGERLDVQRLGEVAVDPVADPPQSG